MEKSMHPGKDARQPEGKARWFQRPDRKTGLLVAAGLLVLCLLTYPIQLIQKQRVEAPTPEQLFIILYPGGTYLGELTDGQAKFVLGVADDATVVCWLLEQVDTGWRASRELRIGAMLARENVMPKSANLYRNAAVETEIIVITKYKSKQDGEEVLGAETHDTAGTEFQCATRDLELGTVYYYFAVVDSGAAGYQLTPW